MQFRRGREAVQQTYAFIADLAALDELFGQAAWVHVEIKKHS